MGTLIRLDDNVVWPVLPILLQDKTMKRNIIWATTSYASLGEYYADSAQMTVTALRNMGSDSIQPRILKAQDEQLKRTRSHGEVYTPAWVCNQMNNHLDEEWFGRKDVFSVQDGQTWTPTEGPVAFPKRKHAKWQLYIDSRRLEITCGEAPFIVSRYDAATGEYLPIERRIGLLDRKLRIVNENAGTEQEWVKWAIRAVQSVYGYEYQGDNLLIARINVLLTFSEYLQAKWQREPTEKELRTVAKVIAWNFWQMDGLMGTVPKGKLQTQEPEIRPITMEELGWFASIDGVAPPELPQKQETMPFCRVCNWRQAHTVIFDSLKTCRGRDVRNMKFDYVIGNPPYQDETLGDNATYAPQVYHTFMDASFEVANKVELIHPARFLFNAGSTPKAWNKKMLDDKHFKVLKYWPNEHDVFPGQIINGGVAVSYRDSEADFGAIEIFSQFPELNVIREKVCSKPGFQSMSIIVYTAYAYHFTEKLYIDHPELLGRMSAGHQYDTKSNVFDLMPEVFSDERYNDTQISILGRKNNTRAIAYIDRDYIVSPDNLDHYKVVISAADGASGTIGKPIPARIVGSPTVASPGQGSTESFSSIGCFECEEDAINLLKYIKTKFARTLLAVLKVTQHITPMKWKYVPLQDFTPASDIDWTQPIPAIDQQLYRKYGLTDEEIAFIESHVKEMT